MKWKNAPYLLLVMAAFFWSGNFIVGRAVRADVPPIALAFYRWLVASGIVFFLARPHLRTDWGMIRQRWPVLLFLSLTGIASFNTLVYLGLQRTVALNGLLLQSMIPVAIVAISFVVYRERLRPVQFLGILISLTGVMTIITHGRPMALLDLSLNTGDLIIFAAVLCYAMYSVGLRKRPPMHPLSVVAVTFAMGVVVLLPFYIWESIVYRPIECNMATFLAVGYVGIFPSILSFLCYNRGVELVGPSRAGMFIHLMPVFGSIMAIVFLGEAFHLFHLLGIGAIACGIFFTVHHRT